MSRLLARILYVLGWLLGDRSRARKGAPKPPAAPQWTRDVSELHQRLQPPDWLADAIARAERCAPPTLEMARVDLAATFDVDQVRARNAFTAERPFRLSKIYVVDSDEKPITFDSGIELQSLIVNGVEQLHGPIPVAVLNAGALVGAPWVQPGQSIAFVLQRPVPPVYESRNVVVQLRGISPIAEGRPAREPEPEPESDRGDPERNDDESEGGASW